MKDFIFSRFLGDLKFIQTEANYYALFYDVLESCATAQLENLLLFNDGKITDAEYSENVLRIQNAKERAIAVHGTWAVKFLKQSKTPHTTETLVRSVYADIFGLPLPDDIE